MELIDFLGAVRRRWRLIAAVMLAALVAVLLTSLGRPPPTYVATNVLAHDAGRGGPDPQVEMAWATDMPTRAAARIGTDHPARLAEQVTMSDDALRGTVAITASDPDPARAALIANAFATEMVGFLPVGYVTQREATADAAAVTRPGSARRLGLASTLGLTAVVAAVGLAVARDRADPRIRTAADAERWFGLPVLAVDDAPTSANGPRTLVMVTSAEAGDSASTTVARLAEAYAEGGRSVLVMSRELWPPVSPQRPGSNGRPALSDTAGDDGADRADVVILDAPPIQSTSLTGELITMVDAVVVACQPGYTTKAAADQCARFLDRLGAPTAGVVLVGRPRGRLIRALDAVRSRRRARPSIAAVTAPPSAAPAKAIAAVSGAARSVPSAEPARKGNGKPVAEPSWARDRELVGRCGAGDQAALEELYRRYWVKLARFCQHRVSDHDRANEIAVNAFLVALRSMPTSSGDTGIYPWMTVIANRLCIDFHRRQSQPESTVARGAVIPDATRGPAVSASPLRDRYLAQLRELCLALPEAGEIETRGRPAFRAGTKVFAVFERPAGEPPGAVAFKPESEDHRRTLLADPRFFPPPYLGPRGWVALDLAAGPVDWDEVTSLVEGSYRRVALKRMLEQLNGHTSERVASRN
ncbi:MAG: MmcQ/YjbR family DNA-binding protein [Acidimicrobiales bacterium]